jgi:hypothetical protein
MPTAEVEIVDAVKIAPAMSWTPEPEPAVVKLVLPPKEPDDPKGRRLGPPQPPLADASLPTPRLVHQNERAPAGLKRFKVRCTNWHEYDLTATPLRYILAKSRAEAEQYFVRSTRLDELIAHRKDAGQTVPAAVVLAVTELPD